MQHLTLMPCQPHGSLMPKATFMRPSPPSSLLVFSCMVALLCGTIGCASQTTLRSTPPGAALALDGAPVGQTPYEMREEAVWLWTKHAVSLEKEGYLPLHVTMSADISPPHLIAGLFCLPFIFVGQYRPTHHWILSPVAQDAPVPAQPTQAPQKRFKEIVYAPDNPNDALKIDFQ